jgi:hypothetical protein
LEFAHDLEHIEAAVGVQNDAMPAGMRRRCVTVHFVRLVVARGSVRRCRCKQSQRTTLIVGIADRLAHPVRRRRSRA